jgi:glycine C-acetyltransferase
MNNPLEPYYKTIEEMKAKGLYTPVRTLESPQGPWFTIDGKKLLNFCSNNYLGFAQDKRLVTAVVKAVKKYGVGAGAVRPISGNMKLQKQRLRNLKVKKRHFFCPGDLSQT